MSQELRLHGDTADKKLNWLIGANYEDDKTNELDPFNDDVSSAYVTGGAPFSVLPFAYFNNFEAGLTDHSRTSSVFGNLEYRVLDDLSAHGGIRYTPGRTKVSSTARASMVSDSPRCSAFCTTDFMVFPHHTPLPHITQLQLR